MKLPFERLPGFIAWYTSPKFPLVIPSRDLAKIIDESSQLEPLESAKLKLAVFEGVGNSPDIRRLADVVSREIERKIESNGWPYSLAFENKDSVSAFEAYTSAFCYLNPRIVIEEIRASIDGHVQYEFSRKKLFGKTPIVSFSQSIIQRVVGPSVEYFVGIEGGDYLYFGQGSISRMFSDELQDLNKKPDYHELMAATYARR